MFDDATPPDWQYYVKSDFLAGWTPTRLSQLAGYGTAPSSPRNQVLLRRLGGRIGDIDPSLRPSVRGAQRRTHAAARGRLSQTRPRTLHRTGTGCAAPGRTMRPWACGTYVNHLGEERRSPAT